MGKIFNTFNVFGWSQEKENSLLATILTGDRALLVGLPGSAKTLLPRKLARGLGVNFGSFDLNASSFEDILGYPNIQDMQQGKLNYLETPGSIWGKEFVAYEEVNRVKPSIQGKALEHLKDGTINGMPTGARWVWANMNPMGQAGTNKLTHAYIDRFAFFVWSPDALDMDEGYRAQIASTVSDTDAPALLSWGEETNYTTLDDTDYFKAGLMLRGVMVKARQYYDSLMVDFPNIPRFLAMFSNILYENMMNKKDEKMPEAIRLSGRRLAYLMRNILSLRAVELALDSEHQVYPVTFRASLQNAINGGIPVGINEEDPPFETVRREINQAVRDCFPVLETGGHDAAEIFTQYALLTSRDPLERIRILINGSIKNDDMINSTWQRLASMNQRSSSTLMFIMLQLDAKLRASGKNGIIPPNVIDMAKRCVNENHVMPELPKLPPQMITKIDELNKLILESTEKDPLLGIVAVEECHAYVHESPEGSWATLQRRIRDRQADYNEIISKVVN